MAHQNILVSDDAPPIRKFLKLVLQSEGYNVFIASDGLEALEIVKKNPIDIAILDIKMPRLNGIEALKEIKKINSGIEVIIITAYADFESLRRSMVEYGAFDYLLKPFKAPDLTAIIKKAALKHGSIRMKETGDKIAQLERDFLERTHELRESQIKHKEIIENSNDMILVVQDGKIKFANRKTFELTEYPENEILDLKFMDLVNPEDRIRIKKNRLNPLESERSSATYSFQAMKKNGEAFLVEANEVRTIWEGKPALLEFIRDISERIQAEQHIRALSQQLMKAQETERQKLSRDLHDHLAQDLSTLKIGIDMLFSDFSGPEALQEVKKKASEFSAILKNSIMAVRDLAYELRPPSLGQFDTARTFGVYCEEFGEKTGINVDYYCVGMNGLKLDQDIEINLYRLMQESLHNIKKHAHATEVKIRLIASFPHIILSIEDNGKGFDVKDRMVKASQEKRMGLRSMEERAVFLHGKMKILSRLNQGTKIFIEVPYTGKNNRLTGATEKN